MPDPFTHFHTGQPRSDPVVGLLRHFAWQHLPPGPRRKITEAHARLAIEIADALPVNRKLIEGLRDLLIAMDSFLVGSGEPAQSDPVAGWKRVDHVVANLGVDHGKH